LDLGWNDQITSLDPLSNCTALTHLDLRCNNQITSLGPLSNCIALTHLDLDCNKQITSLAPLSNSKDNLRKGYLKIGNIDLNLLFFNPS